MTFLLNSEIPSLQIEEKENKPALGNAYGPHHIDVISILVGNLLGDGWAEKRDGKTRFHILISVKNFEYIYSVKKFFEERGYCSCIPLKVIRQTAKGGKVYYSTKVRTYSFSSFNWLYDCFYREKKKQCQQISKSY